MSNVKMVGQDGQEFWCSTRQALALDLLKEANKGGFASVHGYKTGEGEVANYTVLTRFSTERLYQRRLDALNEMTVDDIADIVPKVPKLANLNYADLKVQFDARKEYEMASLRKSLDSERSNNDAHREAHERCYSSVDAGVRVHFVTETVDGRKEPKLVNGFPIVESIMLNIVEIKREVLTEVVRKPVNSGVPVLLSNAMQAKLPKSTKFKALSLKEDNFESISIGGIELVPADIRGDYT